MASNAAATAFVCSDCDLRKITKPSSHWCPVCEEALCTDCNNHHKLRKFTRDHSTIPIEHYHQLPEDILNIKQYCHDHNERYQMFCNTHEIPICSKCIKSHATCTDIVPLDDIISSIKTSEAFNDVITRLEDLKDNIKKIQNTNENNIKSIKEQKDKCEKEINSIRKQIMEHIDRIEIQILSELSTAEEKITSNFNAVLENLKENEKGISECKAAMQDMKQFASDLQTFVGVKDIESRLRKHEHVVHKMMEENTIDSINIEIIIDPKVKDILEEVKSFGSTHVSSTGGSISIVTRKDRQAQFVTQKVLKVNEIDTKNAKKVLQVDNSNSIRGVDIAPNEEILFACHYEGRLLVASTDGSLKFCHSLDHDNYPFDVKYLNNETAVYTSGRSNRKCISIIDLTNRKILNNISFLDKPYGLAVTEESFIVAVEGIGIQSVDRSNFKTSTILSRGLGGFSCIAEFNGCIYFTDQENNNKVICCDMKGQIIWEFENKNVLDYPNGLAVDNHRNIYVAGERSKNVIVISTDGAQYKEILAERKDLSEPTGICFDRQRKKLLVANRKTAAYLYDII